MATTKLYLDTRGIKEGSPASLKIQITHNRKTVYIPTEVKLLPSQWQKETCKVVSHPQKIMLNALIAEQKTRVDMDIIRVFTEGASRRISAHELLERITGNGKDGPGIFVRRFTEFMESRRTPGTQGVYRQTLSRMRAFDPDIENRTFEDIDRKWLKNFEEFLSRTSKSANARSIHFRNIRAVFNEALDDEITSAYPFRKFKISSQPTAKRSLTADQLRLLMQYPVEDYQEIYRDMFVLMFYLCGVNAVDLFNAPADAIVNGRLEYIRAKTGKAYSIKVEPEAMEIINRYRGKSHLLNIMDTRQNYSDFLHRMDRELKKIGPYIRAGRGGRKIITPLFPKLSQYWCRHTWATMAAELDIPKETIAAGLGHSGGTVTDIYIRFDQRKVDDANRRIIDYITHG